ncbi:MAG: hypothetical protein AABW67_04325 [Nanoarchaeota archaeon]
MKIEIINDKIMLRNSFVVMLKTDLKCPQCGKAGMIVKYRYNGKLGMFHETSGILLSCENWGNCSSWWNKGTSAERFPWHTWIGTYHKKLDIMRDNHGERFLEQLKIEDKELYNKIMIIDAEINEHAEVVK